MCGQPVGADQLAQAVGVMWNGLLGRPGPGPWGSAAVVVKV